MSTQRSPRVTTMAEDGLSQSWSSTTTYDHVTTVTVERADAQVVLSIGDPPSEDLFRLGQRRWAPLSAAEARHIASLLNAAADAAEALEAEAVGGAVTDDRPRGGEPAVAGDHDAEALADPVREAPVGALQFGDDGLNDDGEIAQRGGLGVHESSSGEGCDDATVRRVGGGGPTGPAGESAEPSSVPEDIQ